jgi:hypothetical protein
MDPDPSSYLIDFEHINAMLQLCDKQGEVRFTLGERIAPDEKIPLPTSKRQDRGWPEWLTKLFDKNQYFAGRPHCGARQMRAPAA